MSVSRTGVLAGLAVVGVLAAAGPFVAGGVRDAYDQWQAERRWPEQRQELEAFVAEVELPQRYREVPCDGVHVGSERCWQVDAAPADTTGDLLEALAAAGAEDVVDSSDVLGGPPHPTTGEPLAAGVTGWVAPRGVALSASTDVDPAATDPDHMFLQTSTVSLVADLDAP